MIDWEKRRVELFDLWFHERQRTFDDMLDKIIEPEKKMIQEAFRVYHNKTACKDKCEMCEQDKKEINDLLKSMDIEEIK